MLGLARFGFMPLATPVLGLAQFGFTPLANPVPVFSIKEQEKGQYKLWLQAPGLAYRGSWGQSRKAPFL